MEANPCSVCGCGMGAVRPLLRPPTDADGDADACRAAYVYRLPCGHAFHVPCLVGTLRQRPTCPDCGDEASSADPHAAQFVRMVYAGPTADDRAAWNGVVMARARGGVVHIGGTPEEAARLEAVRTRDPQVQAARTQWRAAKRAYNLERARLLALRGKCMSAALCVLRRAELAKWRRTEATMQAALAHVRQVETAALRARFGARSAVNDTYYAPPSALVLHELDPSHRRFWVR